MTTVTIYTTPTCPWCVKTKEFLKKRKVSFREMDVTEDEKARDELVEKSGQMGVPVIDIDGTIIVGYNLEEIEKALPPVKSSTQKATPKAKRKAKTKKK